MHIAKVFENGRSQAIRLPKEFRVEGDQVYLKKAPEGFLVITRDPWELFMEGVEKLSDDFMAEGRKQPPQQHQELGPVIFLLDTDTLVALARGLKSARAAARRQAETLKHRLQQAQSDGDIVGVSAITVSELEYGARNSRDYVSEIAAVHMVLSPFQILDYEHVDCPVQYGQIRYELEAKGRPIGGMDLLIAAHARALDATLVSNNTTHFGRVSGLKVVNWLGVRS